MEFAVLLWESNAATCTLCRVFPCHHARCMGRGGSFKAGSEGGGDRGLLDEAVSSWIGTVCHWSVWKQSAATDSFG